MITSAHNLRTLGVEGEGSILPSESSLRLYEILCQNKAKQPKKNKITHLSLQIRNKTTLCDNFGFPSLAREIGI